MEYVILDLEWNGSYSRKKKGYVNEIIEFGAIKCNDEMVYLDSFHCFVRPQITKKISAVISDLTHITDDNLTEGVTFMRAVSQFRRWANGAVIVTWSTSDILALIENCRYFNGKQDVSFLTHYCNLQRYAQEILAKDSQEQLGLKRAAQLLDIDVDAIDTHRALDDSMLAYEVFKQLYKREEIMPYIEVCNEEFYEQITFKTAYLLDLNDPQVDRSELKFSCPKCSGSCRRKSSWKLKNKSFRAEFLCKACGNPFIGKLTLKQKYHAIAVSKKTFATAVIEQPRPLRPGPIENMQLVEAKNKVGLLQFPTLAGEQGVIHAFSTRIGGVSKAEFGSLNLGFGRGDVQSDVEENYRLFARALGVETDSFVAGAQDHHTNIRVVGKAETGIGIWKPKDMESIDGLCTDETGVTLVIYCADCVPLYFYDAKRRAIGLAHAGWKGTVVGMAAQMVETMKDRYGSAPEDIRVWIGPSICKACFEVDLDVAEVFMALPDSASFVEEGANGKYHVDLWACNRQFLLSAGIPANNIEIGGVCTMKESDLLFSHRKTKGKRGGNAAAMALS